MCADLLQVGAVRPAQQVENFPVGRIEDFAADVFVDRGLMQELLQGIEHMAAFAQHQNQRKIQMVGQIAGDDADGQLAEH